MNSPIHVLGIPGTLRKDGYNKRLLQIASGVLPPAVTLEIYDLAPLPFYNADVEAQGLPESVQHFHARLAAADAYLITTPEYNYSITGALKNALDWASRRTVDGAPAPINNKPLAMMGGGGRSGTLRAQMHLRDMVTHNNMHALNSPQIAIPAVWTKFDKEGNLLDESIREQIRELVAALAAWTRRLRED